jgi:hypothetical protein
VFAFLKRWLFGVPDLPIDQDEPYAGPLYSVGDQWLPAEVKPASKATTRKKKTAKKKTAASKAAPKKPARKRHKAAE